jgi:DNA-binding LacI/PurR family transcriptional regulator
LAGAQSVWSKRLPQSNVKSREVVQMKDVAERARVSVTTVSHVLNGSRFVASDTRDRVLRAASELNYYRNVSARLLRRGRSDSLGLIISDIENPFFPELIKTFEQAALADGFEVLLATTNYDPEQSRKAVRRMIENKVIGVAVMTSQLDDSLIEELVANEVPIVRLDSRDVRRARSTIRVDYSHGAQHAVAHLEELGHTRLALIAGPQNRVSAAAYREALLGAVAAAGMALPVIIEGNNQVGGGAAGVRSLLARRDVPTAILCGNDMAALGAMQELQEAGVKVPADMSVVGSDDIALARFANPPLTTVRIPRDRLGIQAFEALRRLQKNKQQRGAAFELQTELIVRRSTGTAPGRRPS